MVFHGTGDHSGHVFFFVNTLFAEKKSLIAGLFVF
jgi:hypothetical protein